MEPANQEQPREEEVPFIPDTVRRAAALAQGAQTDNVFRSVRSPEFQVGSPENGAILADARVSDRVMFVNAERAVMQRRRDDNRRLQYAQQAQRDPAGTPPAPPASEMQPEAFVLNSFGNTTEEIVTNIYFEQDRAEREAEHYFNLIKPDIELMYREGKLNPASLSASEMASAIRSKVPELPKEDFDRLTKPENNSHYAASLGISTMSMIMDKVRTLHPVFQEGAKIDAEFMQGKWAWDPSNENHRILFDKWSAFKDMQTTDFVTNTWLGFGSLFTNYADLIGGVVSGVVDPNQAINPEWASDPAKRDRVMKTLTKAATVSRKAQQILGLDDTRTLTQSFMGEPDPRRMLVVPNEDMSELLQSEPEYATVIAEMAQLEREGAFVGSRLRVVSSAADGAMQGLAGLGILVGGPLVGATGGLNPNGLLNETMSVIANPVDGIKALVLGEGNFSEEVKSTKMRRANVGRDTAIAQERWTDTGMIFSGPSLYDERQGGFGGQAIDVTAGFSKALKLAKVSRYGRLAGQRIQDAADAARGVEQIAKDGLSIEILAKQGFVKPSTSDLVKSVIDEAKAAGESLSEAEAIERVIAGRVKLNGVELPASVVSSFRDDILASTARAKDLTKSINDIVEIFRQNLPDGTSITPEQILEHLGSDALPSGAGRSIWNAVDAMDPGVRKLIYKRLSDLGPSGKRLLENIQAAGPEKGALYGAYRNLRDAGPTRWLGIAGGGALVGGGIGLIGGNPILGAGLGALTPAAIYVIPDMMQAVGFVGDKARMLDEYAMLSGQGTTYAGSTWLFMARDRASKIAALREEAANSAQFPLKVKEIEKKIEALQADYNTARAMHYMAGTQSAVGTAADIAGTVMYGGMIQELAFSLAVEEQSGMSLGGSFGSALWNSGYHRLLKRNIGGNKDQLFAKQMMDLHLAYQNKPDHQKAALIRVLERAQREGNVRETVSWLASANAKGIDVVLMPEHLASAAVYSWNERIRDKNGNIDFAATVDALINYGMSREEAERHVLINRQNEDARTVNKTQVTELQTKSDELAVKADSIAAGLIEIRDKHNASVIVAESKKAAVQEAKTAFEAAKAVIDSNTNLENPALSNVTDDMRQNLKAAQAKLDDAMREFTLAENVSNRMYERLQKGMTEVRSMRQESSNMAKQARDLGAMFSEKGVPVGGSFFSTDGRIGRRIHEGAYVFDRENGRRTVIINEETATRAGVLEEMYHALEDDAVMQEVRVEAVDILFGQYGQDDAGQPIQTKPGYVDEASVDRWMQMYADGLPISDQEKVEWLHNYRAAKIHYKNTGDARLLYRYTTEVMAKAYVSRKIAMGLYSEKGFSTPQTAGGGFEGSVSPGSSATPGTDILKVIFGDMTMMDYAKAKENGTFRNLAGKIGDTQGFFAIFGRGGAFDQLIYGATISRLERSGVPKENLGPRGANWSGGFMFDENGNRISEPVFDSYITKFMQYSRRSDLGESVDSDFGAMMFRLDKMSEDDQVIWATAHGKKHWLVERKDGRGGYRLKPIAQIVAEYNRAVDKVYTSLTNAVNANGDKMGIRLNVDENGVERLFGAPTQFGLAEINRLVRESDLPVSEQRNFLRIIAGIAGGQMDGEHPGFMPMYDIAYSAVSGNEYPGLAYTRKKYTPYAIDISRTRILREGGKGETSKLHIYLRVIDNENLNNRINTTWEGGLLDENGVPLFTKAQISSLFRNRHEMSMYFGLYLQNLSGAVSPEAIATGAVDTAPDKPMRSWELFTTDPNDPESVARGKAIAEVMYRMLGTRPTLGMEGKKAPRKGDTEKGRKLIQHGRDFELGPDTKTKTGITEDFFDADDDEPGARQEGIFRKIRLDRIGSIVSIKDIATSPTAHGMMPFSTGAYEYSQIAYGTKIRWQRLDLAELNPGGRQPGWWAGAPEEFKEKYGPRITDGFRHDGGFFVFKQKGQENWTVADTRTGEILAKGVKNPMDGMDMATKAAMGRVFPPNNNLEVQMKQLGFFPRGLPDSANGFRSLYQTKEGYTIERKGTSKGRFILRDPYGNIVSKDVIVSVSADVVDGRQLQALMGQAKENARQIRGLKKELPGLPDNFLEFYPMHLTDAQASAQGIVAAKNPTYYKVKDVLNASIGPDNASFVLNLMRQELGDSVLHSDQKATSAWIRNFISERLPNDKGIQARLRHAYPETTGKMMDQSRALFAQMLVLDEVAMAKGGLGVISGALKRPARTLLLDAVLPQRRRIMESRLEEMQAESSRAQKLADAAAAADRKVKAEAAEKAALETRIAEREKRIKAAEARSNQNKEIKEAERIALKAEKDTQMVESRRLQILNELAKNTPEVYRQVLAEFGDPILLTDDPASWRGKDSLWRQARARAKELTLEGARKSKELEARAQDLLGRISAEEAAGRRPLESYGSNFKPEELGEVAKYELAARKEYIRLWEEQQSAERVKELEIQEKWKEVEKLLAERNAAEDAVNKSQERILKELANARESDRRAAQAKHEKLVKYRDSLRERSKVREAAWQKEWDDYRVGIATKDGVIQQDIAGVDARLDNFDKGIARMQAEIAAFEAEPSVQGGNLTTVEEANLSAFIGEFRKARETLRLDATARVNSVRGNSFGWKIVEVYLGETQPRTWMGKVGSVLEGAVGTRGFDVDLQPGQLPQNVVKAMQFSAETNVFGDQRVAAVPGATGVLDYLKKGAGYVGGVGGAAIGTVRVKYLVFNPNGGLVASRDNEDDAFQLAAESHQSR